jgi:hypothetical protein
MDEDLGRFAREHHVHCEIEPEIAADQGDGAVAYEVRLFATHGEARLPAPGCPECQDLLRDLRAFADRTVRAGDASDRTEILAEPPALYASSEVSGADEVALSVRLRCDSAGHRRGDDPCLGAVRDRLREAGVAMR